MSDDTVPKSVSLRSGEPLEQEFEDLAEDLLRAIVQEDPVWATWLGIHGEADHRLPDRSDEGTERLQTKLRDLLGRFESCRSDDLAPLQRTEQQLARGFLAARLALLDRRPPGRVLPQIFVRDVVLGLYTLIERPYAADDERAEAVLGRLEAIPSHLRTAGETLRSPAAVSTDSAILQLQGAEEFVRTAVLAFVDGVRHERLRRRCEAAVQHALAAMDTFREFLLGNLMPHSQGEFRVGKVAFNRLLRDWHMIPFDADDLVVLGEKTYHETLREIRATGQRIRPGHNWSRLLQQLSDEFPAHGDLVRTYLESVEAARRFVAERHLATVPETADLRVVPTPPFARPFYPCAGYVGPAPFESDQSGILWVTRGAPDAPLERREICLRGHSRHGIPIVALHKGFPGHHLQTLRANACGRAIRVALPTPVLVEGWALYCEEMMWKEGFLGDDRLRLMQLRDQLWRACRVIVDVGLHTGKMSFNDAVGFLVRKAKLPRVAAVAEVRRYCEAPTQPMSYIVGKLLLTELREDAEAALGSRFRLGRFHDDLLGRGSLPVELLRQEMEIPRRSGEKELLRALTRTPRPARSSGRTRRGRVRASAASGS